MIPVKYILDTRLHNKKYLVLRKPSRDGRQIFEHVLIAEKALGKPLPKGAEVHHVNEIKTDNRPSNLVICPDLAYHRLLHQRMRAKKACGNASWLKCDYCKEYDEPANMYVYQNRRKGHHKACMLKRQRELKNNNADYHANIKARHRAYWNQNKDEINRRRREKRGASR